MDQGLSQSKNGNPQIWLRILPKESLTPEDHDIELPSHERTVYWTITDKTIDFITDKLATLGFTGESFRQLDLNHNKPESFVGQLEDFYCKHETYNGEEREKWDLSRGDFEMKPLDDSEARKLDALFGKNLKSLSKKSEKASPKKTRQTVPAEDFNPEPTESDDIPF